MRPSESLMAFLRHWEGLPGGKPALESYDDGGGVWTIGYGHTHNVQPGDVCSAEMANDWLEADAAIASGVVDIHVIPTLTQHEFDALTSFVLNVGPGKEGVKDGFVTLKSGRQSTMLRRLNENNFFAAAEEFPKWNRQAGAISTGLVKRRFAEQQIFVNADYTNTP